MSPLGLTHSETFIHGKLLERADSVLPFDESSRRLGEWAGQYAVAMVIAAQYFCAATGAKEKPNPEIRIVAPGSGTGGLEIVTALTAEATAKKWRALRVQSPSLVDDHFPDIHVSHVTGFDISADAVKNTIVNYEKLLPSHTTTQVFQGDWDNTKTWEKLPDNFFTVAVCNPPFNQENQPINQPGYDSVDRQATHHKAPYQLYKHLVASTLPKLAPEWSQLFLRMKRPDEELAESPENDIAWRLYLDPEIPYDPTRGLVMRTDFAEQFSEQRTWFIRNFHLQLLAPLYPFPGVLDDPAVSHARSSSTASVAQYIKWLTSASKPVSFGTVEYR